MRETAAPIREMRWDGGRQAFRPCGFCHVLRAQAQVSGQEFICAVNALINRPSVLEGLFLFAEISRTIRVVLGLVGQAGFDGIIVNV